MAVAVRPSRSTLSAPDLVVARGSVAAVRLLACLVGVSFVVRAVLGWVRATPVYFSDEYLYSSLARSIAETGHPLVRGEAANFPALLQPILTAPAWLLSDVAVSYHAAQMLGALAMSLAAVPVYWLSRRVGLGGGVSVAAATLALVLPDLVYAGWMVSEPFAYPLALGAVAAAVAVLERPSRRSQLVFVALAGLAAFARIQFVVIPVCFALAVLVVGLRDSRVRAAAREQLMPLALFAFPVAAAVVLGPSRVLAYYQGVIHVHLQLGQFVQSTGMNLLVLVYAGGFVLVPGAMLGLALAFARPRSRAETAFGAMTVLLLLALLVEAGLFGATEQAQERYLFYVLPLAAIAFGLLASRGWPYRLQHALIAAGLVTVAAVMPLAGYAAADEKAHAPALYGVYRIEQWLGSPGNGSLAVALAVTAGLAVLVAASLRPRVATGVGLCAAIAISAGIGAATVVFDHDNSSSVRKSFLPADRSWVDHARVGDVTLVRNIAGVRGAAFQQMFWNRSVKRLVVMPGAPGIDAFRADRVQVADDGGLVAGGRPLTGSLLVDEHAVTTRFNGVEEVASAPGYSLYRALTRPRLSLFLLGRYEDGWLAGRGTIDLWPRPGTNRLRGSLVFDVESPAPLKATTLVLQLPHGRHVRVAVPRSRSTRVRVPVCSRGPWVAGFHSPVRGFVGDRPVSVKATVPRLVPGPVDCRALPLHEPAPPALAGPTA